MQQRRRIWLGTNLKEGEHGLQKIAVKERIVLAEKHHADDGIDVEDQQQQNQDIRDRLG